MGAIVCGIEQVSITNPETGSIEKIWKPTRMVQEVKRNQSGPPMRIGEREQGKRSRMQISNT